MAIVSYAVLSDLHFPYEGPGYYKALDQMRTWKNLTDIYLNGDVLEIESCSSHPRTPMAQQYLLDEMEYANRKFDTLKKMFPKARVHYIAGNHENRIFRYMRDVAPQLWDLIKAEKLMKLQERGWQFHEYGPTQWVKVGETKDLYARHEPLSMGVNHARATAEKSVVSVVYGHVHQRAEHTCKKLGPTPYHVTAYSPGWLGDITKSCFDYRGSRDNWTCGYARVECESKSGEYEVNLIKT